MHACSLTLLSSVYRDIMSEVVSAMDCLLLLARQAWKPLHRLSHSLVLVRESRSTFGADKACKELYLKFGTICSNIYGGRFVQYFVSSNIDSAVLCDLMISGVHPHQFNNILL